MNLVLVLLIFVFNISDFLDFVLISVVVNFGYVILRLNIKRKIIEVLREDYIERLELVVKGR